MLSQINLGHEATWHLFHYHTNSAGPTEKTTDKDQIDAGGHAQL